MTENDVIEAESSDEANPGKKSSGKFGVVIVLILLSGMGAGYYLYQHNQQLNSRLSVAENKLESFSAVNTSLTGLEQRLQSLQSQQASSNAGLEQIEQTLESLYDDLATSSDDWVISEVEQLILIAVYQLELDADVNTAIAAMEAADEVLQGMAHPRALEIRRQTRSDINQLRSVNHPDITGMVLSLSDIAERIELLPLKEGAMIETADETTSESAPQETSMLDSFLSTIWTELKGLIAISRQNENSIIALLPDQKYYLYQNLRLEINIARLSLLQKDEVSLHASADALINWLEQYFDIEDASVSNIIKTVAELKQIDLSPPLPDLNTSLESVRAFIQESNQGR